MHAFLSSRSTTVGVGPDVRLLTTTARAALAGSVVLAALLHLRWFEQVDPVGQTLSDYALHEGAAALFTASVGAVATGAVALLVGLVHSRLPIGVLAPTALGVACAGLVVSAVFPTDPSGSAPSMDGLVHRYAAGAVVAALPAAGLLLSRRLLGHASVRARRIRRLSWASSVAALCFLGTHLSVVHPDTPVTADAAGLLGLAERLTLGLEVALLFAMADVLRGGRNR